VDLAKVEESINSELSVSRIHMGSSPPDTSGLASAVAEEGPMAEGGNQEPQGKLAPHNLRHKDQPCCLPDSLLWQITAGKRGAFRLSLSPSGQLLAVAVARQGGASELRVVNVASGRVHAVCAVVHDALVYDLCWHSFRTNGLTAHHPLLISCSSDCVVQVYEVPDEAKALATPLLRPQASLHLPSHVYTVRPHPAVSADPRRLVLMCGGHSFGLMLCELVRQGQTDGQQPGKWMLVAMEPVLMTKVPAQSNTASSETALRRSPTALAEQRLEAKEPGHIPDVLCLRFSTQPNTPDNMYVSDAAGRVMLFQVRFDATLQFGQGSMRASFVRVYSAPNLAGVPVYALDVVTPQLVQGRRLNHIQLSMVDDWLLLYARDHIVRLCSLQRGVVRVELEMSGLENASFPVRGAMSPDGTYVACGSETGELLVWGAADGKPLPASSVPQVQLAGPVMDVVWSERHHLLACCALDEQAPPLLIFVGGDPAYVPPPSPPARQGALELPLRPVPLRDAPQEELSGFGRSEARAMPLSVAPPVAASHRWAMQWLDMDANPRSALAFEEKRAMKEKILSQLLDRKGALELEQHFASMRMPGGL